MTARRVQLSALLLGAALVTWILVVLRLRGMDAGPGTDLGGLGWYLGIWVTMTAALMVPSAVAAGRHVARLARLLPTLLFSAGYLGGGAGGGPPGLGVFRLLASFDTSWRTRG